MTAKSGIGRERTRFELALLGVSLAATLAVAIGLVVSGLTGPSGPADLTVTIVDAAEPASGGRPLDVTVRNVGGTSAGNVIVEVIVGDITREVNLDQVAKGDAETATVVVPADDSEPAYAEVVSYTNP